MYDTRYTKTFTDSLRKFHSRPEVLASLAITLDEVANQPFGNPRLQTHAVKNCPQGTYTSYVGNNGHRLIWRLVDRVIVLLLIDEHDAAYQRAERIRLQIDDRQNDLRVIDVDPVTEGQQTYEERRQTEGTLFMAWSDRELASMGFQDQELPILRRLDSEHDLYDLEPRMRSDAFEVAYNLVAFGHPEGEAAAVRSRQIREAAERHEPAVAEPGATNGDRELQRALADPASSRDVVSASLEDLQAILAAPIEDWMVYLDPSQHDLVERRFKGPGRIRGAAGTGKTVVALHRARRAVEADDQARVLFTTFIKSIPPVLEHIFSRFAPSQADRVEFTNVHSWALKLLRQAGRPVNIDTGRTEKSWKRACDRILTATSPLTRTGLSRSYLREEIDYIIKGRGLTQPDQYLALRRSGRGTALSRELRTGAWRLYEQYQAELRASGVHDFNDVLINALELVASDGIDPPYTAVIVDEAQDLTEVAIRLLYTAVGDRENGLLLVGDGQQSIYPGGFSLGSVGIDIRGRAALLSLNYRNTRQIMQSAMAVVSDDAYDDGRDDLESGQREVATTRDGTPPSRNEFASVDDHDLALAAGIESALDEGCGPGDVAILAPTNRLVDHYASTIAKIGLPTQKLDRYDGQPNSLVKVGTYQRAKGLEFKRVYLPRLDPEGQHDEPRHGEDETMHSERLALQRRRLFVAMTRARDALWLGWIGKPSKLISSGETTPPHQRHQRRWL